MYPFSLFTKKARLLNHDLVCQFMLSVSKLARVAACTRAEAERSEPVQQTLEAIDDRLDIVASHDRLMEVCKTVLDPRDLLKPVETQATVLMGRLCSRVTNAEVMKVSTPARQNLELS